VNGRVIERLVVKYESLRTLHEGCSEVRRYRNDLTGVERVGKRIDTLGLEESVAVLEGKLLQTIRHDNIVQVFEVGHVEDANRYPPPMNVIELVMPYFPRGSLHDALDRGERFSVREACLLAQAALRGLGELHEQHGILHRDVKAGNVFLSDDGSLLKVGDLGIAAPMGVAGSTEPFPGNGLYTPPETFTASRVDRRYDLYGVGVLLLELLNGPLPWGDYSAKERQKRLHKGRSALRSAHLRPGAHVPPQLRTIIRKATSADPAARHPSAGAMSHSLSRVAFVDWGPVQDGGDVLLWEGESAQRRDRRFQVEVRKRRKGRWTMTACQFVTSWRRFMPVQFVEDPAGPEATAFFDQVLRAACRP
jgi:eukaryotic-like serine/threonine-protein kinase